jgi:hypothetical protein
MLMAEIMIANAEMIYVCISVFIGLLDVEDDGNGEEDEEDKHETACPKVLVEVLAVKFIPIGSTVFSHFHTIEQEFVLILQILVGCYLGLQLLTEKFFCV